MRKFPGRWWVLLVLCAAIGCGKDAAPRSHDEPAAGSQAAPADRPEFRNTLYVDDPSSLIWPDKGPVAASVTVDGEVVWRGKIEDTGVTPEWLDIKLTKELPRSGVIHVSVTVGDAVHEGTVSAVGMGVVDVHCRTSPARIEIDRDLGALRL